MIHKKLLSIIIPVYNEEKRLSKTYSQIENYLKSIITKYDYELIFCNDGSKDGTFKLINGITKQNNNVRILNELINKGKGYSVKSGVLSSLGKYILFMDCDLSTDIYEINNFLQLFETTNYDIIIGSRALKDSNIKTRFYKKALGRLSNLLISLVVKDIKDTQCGFKMFRREVAMKIFPKQTIERWGFDFEILYLAQKYKYKIKEQPIKWIEDKDSKVKLKDYPKTLMELIQLKINDIKGLYND